jgi:DNA-binding IclR family transcriptional regulator
LRKYLDRVGLPAMTPHTVTDAPTLRSLLRQIRRHGYALSFQQMYLGARGVAVPIFDPEGAAVASLGISGPHPRFTDRKARGLAATLHKHAAAISGVLQQLVEGADATGTQSNGKENPHGSTGRRSRP